MAHNSAGHLSHLYQAAVVDLGYERPRRKLLSSRAHLHQVTAHLVGCERYLQLAHAAWLILDSRAHLALRGC